MPVMVQDYMDPTQAGAINMMAPGPGGMAPPSPSPAALPQQPGVQGGNPVAQLLAQVADLIIARQGAPEDAAAVEQFLQFILSLQPGGQSPESQSPVGQGAMPQGPMPMPQSAAPGAMPMPSNNVQPLPLPPR